MAREEYRPHPDLLRREKEQLSRFLKVFMILSPSPLRRLRFKGADNLPDDGGLAKRRKTIHPLPGREGRGEGERELYFYRKRGGTHKKFSTPAGLRLS